MLKSKSLFALALSCCAALAQTPSDPSQNAASSNGQAAPAGHREVGEHGGRRRCSVDQCHSLLGLQGQLVLQVAEHGAQGPDLT